MPSPTTPLAVAVTPVALSVALLCMASSATA